MYLHYHRRPKRSARNSDPENEAQSPGEEAGSVPSTEFYPTIHDSISPLLIFRAYRDGCSRLPPTHPSSTPDLEAIRSKEAVVFVKDTTDSLGAKKPLECQVHTRHQHNVLVWPQPRALP